MFLVPFLAGFALAAPYELRAAQPIEAIAADGRSVSFGYCGTVLRWTPAKHPHPTVHGTCGLAIQPFVGVLAQAGTSNAWLAFIGGNHTFMTMFARPSGGVAYPVAYDESLAIDPLGPAYVGLLGGGGSFVYTHWLVCTGCAGDDVAEGMNNPFGSRVQRSSLYRLVPGSPPVAITTREGDYESLAIDADHIAVRRHLNGLDILDRDGRLVTSFDFPTRVLGSELDGPNIDIVIGDGEVREYDISTHTLIATSSIAAGGYDVTCLRLFCLSALRVAGAANGRLAYLQNGSLYLLDIATGTTCTIGTATNARLNGSGLYYTYKGAAPWLGRLRFLPAPVPVCVPSGQSIE